MNARLDARQGVPHEGKFARLLDAAGGAWLNVQRDARQFWARASAIYIRRPPSCPPARLSCISPVPIFRLLPDRVQVVDLIPRQDLLRRSKTLH